MVIEGKNSIALENCDVNGNMSDTEGTSSDENVHNVMIYQSMSGDANVGICGNSASHGWGTAGSNGAQVTFTASDQTLAGDIVVDTISTLDMTLSDNSTFNGTINFNGYTITLADGTVLK